MVTAMGVRIQTQSAAGLPSPPIEAPFGTVAGDATQPAVVVTWQLAPAGKSTVQFNTKRRTICVKGREGEMEVRKDKFVTFFGPPIAATGPAAGKVNAQAPPVCIRDLLVGGAGGPGVSGPGGQRRISDYVQMSDFSFQI